MTDPADGLTRSTATSGAASRLVRRWVRLYTTRLAPDLRDGRRAEIDSDLWEQLTDAQADHNPQFATQLDVIARMLKGIPSDLAWRGRAHRTMKETRSMKQRLLRITAVSCIAIALTSFFGTNLLLDKSNAESADTIWWVLAIPIGFLLVGTMGLVATGLLIRERREVRAATH